MRIWGNEELIIWWCVTVWHEYEGQYSHKMANTLGDMLQISLILLSILIFVCFCVQGGFFGIVSKTTSLCDIQHNTRRLYPCMNGLGGGPECFLCSLVHILNGLLLISLQLKWFYFWFFDVTQWRSVQIWGDLPNRQWCNFQKVGKERWKNIFPI